MATNKGTRLLAITFLYVLSPFFPSCTPSSCLRLILNLVTMNPSNANNMSKINQLGAPSTPMARPIKNEAIDPLLVRSPKYNESAESTMHSIRTTSMLVSVITSLNLLYDIKQAVIISIIWKCRRLFVLEFHKFHGLFFLPLL